MSDESDIKIRLEQEIEWAKDNHQYDVLRKLLQIRDGCIIITPENEEELGYWK